MKHLTRVVATASALALVAGAATVPAAHAADAITLGFSPISLQIPAMTGIWQGFQGYGASKGVNAVIADPNFDGATQAQQISAWATNHQVKGFWAITQSPTALTAALKVASDNGVVGVVNGTPSDYGLTGMQKGITFAVIDYAKLGTGVGTLLGKCLASRYPKGAQIIWIANPAGTPGDAAQSGAMKAALKKYAPKSKIVAAVSGEGKIDVSQTAVASALQAHPMAVSVVGFSDEAALGGAAALKAAGLKAKKTCVVGAGGGDNTFAALKDGSIYGEGVLDFQADLTQNIDMLIKMAKNPSAKGVQLSTPVKIVGGTAK